MVLILEALFYSNQYIQLHEGRKRIVSKVFLTALFLIIKVVGLTF